MWTILVSSKKMFIFYALFIIVFFFIKSDQRVSPCQILSLKILFISNERIPSKICFGMIKNPIQLYLYSLLRALRKATEKFCYFLKENWIFKEKRNTNAFQSTFLFPLILLIFSLVSLLGFF